MGKKKKGSPRKPEKENSQPGTNAPKFSANTKWQDEDSAFHIGHDERDMLLEYWEGLDMEQKRDILSVDASNITSAITRLTKGAIDITGAPSEVMVQQSLGYFIQALENKTGVIHLPKNTSLGVIGIYSVLEDQTLRAYYNYRIRRMSVAIVLWAFLHSSYPFMGILAVLVVVVGKVPGFYDVYRYFFSMMEVFADFDVCTCCVKWKSDCFAGGALLVVMTKHWGDGYMVVVAIMAMLPFLVGLAEDHKQGSGPDQEGLKNIRSGLWWVEVVVLLVAAWFHGYISLCLVFFLFAPTYGKALLLALFTAAGVILNTCTFVCMCWMSPATRYQWTDWYSRGYNSLLLILPLDTTLLYLIYSMWDYEEWWAGLLRLLLPCFMVQMVSGDVIEMVLGGLVAFGLALPLHVFMLVVNKIRSVLGFKSSEAEADTS